MSSGSPIVPCPICHVKRRPEAHVGSGSMAASTATPFKRLALPGSWHAPYMIVYRNVHSDSHLFNPKVTGNVCSYCEMTSVIILKPLFLFNSIWLNPNEDKLQAASIPSCLALRTTVELVQRAVVGRREEDVHALKQTQFACPPHVDMHCFKLRSKSINMIWPAIERFAKKRQVSSLF